MKIFYAYNEDFSDMLNSFLNSMKDQWDTMGFKIEDFKLKGQVAGGREADLMRKNLLDYAFSNTKPDEIFVMSDIDILFYKPCVPIVENEFSKMQNILLDSGLVEKEKDIIFQRERVNHGVNMGFMAMKNNERVRDFWNRVYKISLSKKLWDQPIVNDLLYENLIEKCATHSRYKNVNKEIWDVFPRSIWNWSIGYADPEICLHHANCAVSKKEKNGQFEKVKAIIQKAKSEEREQVRQQLNLISSSNEVAEEREIELNLFGRADLEKSTGKWVVSNGSIESDNSAPAKIGFNCNPYFEFEFCAEFSRIEGSQAICQYCSVGLQKFIFMVGGWDNRIAGLSLVNGKEARDNFTTFFQKNMIGKERHTTKVAVKINRIECFLDDKLIISIPRFAHELKCEQQYSINNKLGICTWKSPTKFHNLSIKKINTKNDLLEKLLNGYVEANI